MADPNAHHETDDDYVLRRDRGFRRSVQIVQPDMRHTLLEPLHHPRRQCLSAAHHLR